MTHYEKKLGLEVWRPHQVTAVERAEGADAGLVVHCSDGTTVAARAVVAASGCNMTPKLPQVAASDSASAFRKHGGTIIHSSEYFGPEPFIGKRVVVCGEDEFRSIVSELP